MKGKMSILDNMYPEFFHIVERLCTPSWRIEDANYKMHNIILLYDGKASFTCNGKEFDAYRGSMVYFKPGDARAGFTYADNLMKCYAIDFLYTCPFFADGAWRLEHANLPFHPHEIIKNKYLLSRLFALFHELTSIWIAKKNNMSMRLRTVFAEIVHLLLAYKQDCQIDFDKVKKVETAINYMVENLNRKIHLDDISKSIGISTSHLGCIFKEITGKSPVDYLNKMRINKAKDLLQEGATVSEAAFLLGFSDIFYFSKCFKKHEGSNPSDYKKIN